MEPLVYSYRIEERSSCERIAGRFEVATFTDDCYVCKPPYHWMCVVLPQNLEPCSSSGCHHFPLWINPVAKSWNPIGHEKPNFSAGGPLTFNVWDTAGQDYGSGRHCLKKCSSLNGTSEYLHEFSPENRPAGEVRRPSRWLLHPRFEPGTHTINGMCIACTPCESDMAMLFIYIYIDNVDEILELTEEDEHYLIQKENDMAKVVHQLRSAGYEPDITYQVGMISQVRARFRFRKLKKDHPLHIYSTEFIQVRRTLPNSATIRREVQQTDQSNV